MNEDLQLDAAGLAELIHRLETEDEPAQTLLQLRAIRWSLARLWLDLPADKLPAAWQGTAGQFHRMLMASGLRDEPAADGKDANLAAQARARAGGSWDDLRTPGGFIAAMLFHLPFELSVQLDFPRVPSWLINDLLHYLLEGPGAFQNVGDCDRHVAHTQRLTDYIHAHVFANPADPLWRQAASTFAKRIAIIPLYFSNADLAPILGRRGDILEFVLSQAGHAVDHTFLSRDREAPSRRIRFGVFVTNLRSNNTGSYTTFAMYEHLDRLKFEVIAYYFETSPPELEKDWRQRVERVVLLPSTLRELVPAVRADDLDLLLYTHNLSATTSLYAKSAVHRLARVQLVNFDSPVTTGLRNIDYFTSGDLSEPPDAARSYRESLVLIEGCGFNCEVSHDPKPSSLRADRAAVGIAADALVYASTANYFKFVPELIIAWASVLLRTPNSVLLICPFGSMWADRYPVRNFIRRMHAMLKREGVDPARLLIAPGQPGRAGVQQLLSVADVYLDSFPHTGANSLLDALEIGLPCVTLLGQTMRGRHGPAMLLEMGINELVANDAAGYIDLAVRLGTDSQFRAEMRQRVEQEMQKPPLFLDSRRFSDLLSPLYEKLLQDWDARNAPLTEE